MRMGTKSGKVNWRGLRSFCMSFVVSIITHAVRKLLHSSSMLPRLVIGIPKPYHACVIGQSICIPPPVMRSPIKLCCISAAKYGMAFFL
mgnify:CR=1 FL=1